MRKTAENLLLFVLPKFNPLTYQHAVFVCFHSRIRIVEGETVGGDNCVTSRRLTTKNKFAL